MSLRGDRPEPGLAVSPWTAAHTHGFLAPVELWSEAEGRWHTGRDGLVRTEGARPPRRPRWEDESEAISCFTSGSRWAQGGKQRLTSLCHLG